METNELDDYLRELARETSVGDAFKMSHPSRSRMQFHLLAEEQRAHREMLERRREELLELEITGDSSEDSSEAEQPKKYPYKVKNCADDHKHNIHVHDQPLIVGKVYNLKFANHHHDGCYLVTSEHPHEALYAWPISGPFDTCGECS